MELFKLVGSIFIDNEKADNSISKTDEKAEKLSKRFLDGIKTVGKWGAGIATAAAGAVTAVGVAVTKIADDTREYRNEMKKLETAFEDSNFKAETARDTYQSLQSILGDTGQAVEASNFLAELCNTEKELADWTTICTGIYAKFGVSLPVEGLTEASNETAKTGVVTGNLADALNWAAKEGETFGLTLKENIEFTELSSKELKALTEEEKVEYEAKKAQYEAIEEFNKALSEATVAEDVFNLALAECSTEQERQALITETLYGLYSDIGEIYRDNNEAVIKANEAQEKLNEALARVGELVEPVVTEMKLLGASILEKVVPATENFIDKAKSLDGWFETIGNYASEKLGPIISDLEPIFTTVKDSVQYLIDKINVYIESGSAAEDITNAVKGAIDFLAEAYKKAKEQLDTIIQGFKDAVEWGKEHKTEVTLLNIAFLTLTTALIAHNREVIAGNAAKLAKKAIDIAETAQIYLLIAAENAHTIATTIATGATTAFSAAVAFLTSPVTLAIAAIGALVAVGVLLYQNWDTIKEKASQLRENLSATFENIKISITNKIDTMKTNAIQKIDDLKNGMVDKVNSAKEKILGIVDKIKGFFDFTFKVPKIKLPHFSIKPKGWDIGDLLDGSIPKLGIEWYAKAMNKPIIMKSPTAFGINASGKVMAGGEAGTEVLSGVDTLMSMISHAVASNDTELILEIREGFDRLIALLSEYLPELANMQLIMNIGDKKFTNALTEIVVKKIEGNVKNSMKVKGGIA